MAVTESMKSRYFIAGAIMLVAVVFGLYVFSGVGAMPPAPVPAALQ